MKTGFISTESKGFHITFKNGLSLSVQWGKGNYCSNYNGDFYNSFCRGAESATAEVAVFKGNDFMDINMFLPEGIHNDGQVAGHLIPEEVVDLLVKVKEYEF